MAAPGGTAPLTSMQSVAQTLETGTSRTDNALPRHHEPGSGNLRR
jgi:hypothetical protein